VLRGLTVGKDFRTGLIAGVVMAIVAVVWVATRPSLSPQARMLRSSQGGSPTDSPRQNTRPWETVSPPPETAAPQREPSILPAADGTAAQPKATPTDLAPPPAPPTATGAVASSASPALPDLTIYEKDEPIKTTRFHIVRRGESLSVIARQYYGSSNEWRRILSANSKTIKDANKITPGTKLIIPQ
jgi:nucleoid-associated protein YgaU